MRFLIDEDLPRSTADLLREYGHEPIDVRDVGLRGASDGEVAAYAQQNRLCLLSGDLGFADIRNYPPSKYAGLVVLRLPAKATSFIALSLLRGLLTQAEIVAQLEGKLAVVELFWLTLQAFLYVLRQFISTQYKIRPSEA